MSIVLHPGQSKVFEDLFVTCLYRFVVVVCSRGWGKSYFAATAAASAIFELFKLRADVPHKNVYIVAPTYTQVTDIYFPLLAYELGLARYAIKTSRDLGRFWFPNDIELRLISYEAIERIRGTGAYLVIMDEPSSYNKGLSFKEAWQGIIEPCIKTRWSKKRAIAYRSPHPGRAIVIGTPKGYNFLYDMYNFQERDEEWHSYHYNYTTSPFLDTDEIERLIHTIDPLEFNREYKATFQDSGNSVFYNFDRKLHVRKDLEWFFPPEGSLKGEDVHIAMDFNVGIQATSAWAIRGDQAHCLKEWKGHPDTESLATTLRGEFPKDKHRVFIYPDPSGNSRKTSAPVGQTDFSILRSHGFALCAKTHAPPIVDSVQAVNRRLKTQAGDVRMFVSSECPGVITSLERTTWLDNNPDSAQIDKAEGVEHYSDGIRYFTDFKFPVLAGTSVTKRSNSKF